MKIKEQKAQKSVLSKRHLNWKITSETTQLEKKVNSVGKTEIHIIQIVLKKIIKKQ